MLETVSGNGNQPVQHRLGPSLAQIGDDVQNLVDRNALRASVRRCARRGYPAVVPLMRLPAVSDASGMLAKLPGDDQPAGCSRHEESSFGPRPSGQSALQRKPHLLARERMGAERVVRETQTIVIPRRQRPVAPTRVGSNIPFSELLQIAYHAARTGYVPATS